jgi:hypothetical protein
MPTQELSPGCQVFTSASFKLPIFVRPRRPKLTKFPKKRCRRSPPGFRRSRQKSRCCIFLCGKSGATAISSPCRFGATSFRFTSRPFSRRYGYFVQPLVSTVVYQVVFGNIARLPTNNIPPFLFYMSGIVIWSVMNTARSCRLLRKRSRRKGRQENSF